MNIMLQLAQQSIWQEYLDYKVFGGHLREEELKELETFVLEKRYQDLVERLQNGGTFSPPRKACINKKYTGKKRIVYIYSKEESYVLKLLTFLLQRKYDHLFADNLYSFRMNRSVKDAVKKVTQTKGIQNMFSYKVDISNYFNSVCVDRMIAIIREIMHEETEVCRFLTSILENPLVNDQGKIIAEEKGIMAGTSIATFLANLYLYKMDHIFEEEGILYARYSDDIIVFADTQDALNQYIKKIHDTLSEAGLKINRDKEFCTRPGETWTFLGISYQNGVIDVAPVSVEKLKAKMKRKARALMRWKARKGATGVNAAKAYVRAFNRKLFENPIEQELTWTRWYFPLINTAQSLKVIDQYSQSCIRYLATGKRTKAAYNFRYEQMKELGYVSLVNCYYKHQRGLDKESVL